MALEEMGMTEQSVVLYVICATNRRGDQVMSILNRNGKRELILFQEMSLTAHHFSGI